MTLRKRTLAVCLVMIMISSAVLAQQEGRSIEILNESGKNIELYWVHPDTDELHVIGGSISNEKSFSLNSFVGHTFEIHEVASAKTGECGDAYSNDNSCRVANFQVNRQLDQVFVIQLGMTVRHTDKRSISEAETTETVADCRAQALDLVKDAHTLPLAQAGRTLDGLVGCMQRSISRTFEDSDEEVGYQAIVRTEIAALLENYTCADNELPSTPPKQVRQWTRHGVTRDVNILHELDASRIHVVSDFITEEECKAMEDAAKPILHRATVADGAGGSQLSDSRRAMQAGIKVPWDQEKDGNPIATVSRKVYDYVNHVLGLNIDEFGQEDLMSIQYSGRGINDTTPDRYMPHCDGDCGGLQFKPGNRMSTMVMYCDVPEVGGATNFRNAGLHVVPQKGAATFFSYIDPDTMTMDKGFTEHSGCPVVEGEKKIVTQWVRLGVDNENPWDSFNTLGIKKSDAATQ